jgi:hypothetical protein
MNEIQKPSKFAFLKDTIEHRGPSNYLFFAVVCLALNMFLLADAGLDLFAAFSVLLALPGLIGRYSSSPFLYFAFVGYQLFDPGFFGLLSRFAKDQSIPVRLPNLEKILLAVGILGYTMAQLRLLTFWRSFLPKRFQNRDDQIERTEGNLIRPLYDAPEVETYDFLIQLFCCGIVSALLLRAIDGCSEIAARAKVPLESNFIGFGIAVLTIATVLLVFRLLCMLLEMRKMTRERAYLQLADELWRETRREQQRFARWRKWLRERALKNGRIDR